MRLRTPNCRVEQVHRWTDREHAAAVRFLVSFLNRSSHPRTSRFDPVACGWFCLAISRWKATSPTMLFHSSWTFSFVRGRRRKRERASNASSFLPTQTSQRVREGVNANFKYRGRYHLYAERDSESCVSRQVHRSV